jgi:hypothetical protein
MNQSMKTSGYLNEIIAIVLRVDDIITSGDSVTRTVEIVNRSLGRIEATFHGEKARQFSKNVDDVITITNVEIDNSLDVYKLKSTKNTTIRGVLNTHMVNEIQEWWSKANATSASDISNSIATPKDIPEPLMGETSDKHFDEFEKGSDLSEESEGENSSKSDNEDGDGPFLQSREFVSSDVDTNTTLDEENKDENVEHQDVDADDASFYEIDDFFKNGDPYSKARISERISTPVGEPGPSRRSPKKQQNSPSLKKRILDEFLSDDDGGTFLDSVDYTNFDEEISKVCGDPGVSKRPNKKICL